MNNPLTPVEALQREIDCTRVAGPVYKVCIAALELAKVDAEYQIAMNGCGFGLYENAKRLDDALDDARTRLYEVLQR